MNFFTRYRRVFGMFLLLLGLIGVTIFGTTEYDSRALLGSKFLGDGSNIFNVLRQIGMYGIFGIGVGMIIITGGIDLSIGSLIALLGVIFFMLIDPDGKMEAAGSITGTMVASTCVMLLGVALSFIRKLPRWATLGATVLVAVGFGLFVATFLRMITENQDIEPAQFALYMNWKPALFCMLGLSIAIGAFHGASVAKMKMQAFIVTLCGLLAYRGLAKVLTDDNSVNVQKDVLLPELSKLAESGVQVLSFSSTTPSGEAFDFVLKIPYALILLLVVAFFAYILLQRSVFGRYLYAIGRNEDAARYSGIDTTRVIAMAYVIGGFLTGLSALLWCLYTGTVSPASHGNFYELWGIAAAVLGGCSLRGGEGTIAGVVIGTAIIVVLNNMVILLGIGTSFTWVLIGVVIYIGVLVDQVGGDVLASVRKLFKRS